MKVVIQRVKSASVSVKGKMISEIGHGLFVLLGIGLYDKNEDADWLIKKVCQLRIFEDENGVMNHSLIDVNGEALVVSQFTLHAKTKKGNRPSYIKAAKPETAVPLYEYFIRKLELATGKTVKTGKFGKMMDIHQNNYGPVTIVIDTKNKE